MAVREEEIDQELVEDGMTRRMGNPSEGFGWMKRMVL